MKNNFSNNIITWYKKNGRLELPWRQQINPYRVWLSEIMLQQTQVKTVIDYFKRFLQRFPDIKTLATAELDEVLTYWAGLGYYSRARNLYKTAVIIHSQFHDQFPDDVITLETLPGIGRSTAAAIAAIAFQKRAAILDGNVKRVLARYFAIQGWPNLPAVNKLLWQKAAELLPEQECDVYTQALMDLGATICTPKNPNCGQCPVKNNCQAFQQQLQYTLPTAKPKKAIPQKQCVMFIIRNQHQEILLQKRPERGIWGGLWSLIEAPVSASASSSAKAEDLWQLLQEIPAFTGMTLENARPFNTLEPFYHVFTHFRLHIQPILIEIRQNHLLATENSQLGWFSQETITQIGLPAPVKKLLRKIYADND